MNTQGNGKCVMGRDQFREYRFRLAQRRKLRAMARDNKEADQYRFAMFTPDAEEMVRRGLEKGFHIEVHEAGKRGV